MKYRILLYLRPAGAQDAPQLIQGVPNESTYTGPESVLSWEIRQLWERIERKRFIYIEIERTWRPLIVATADIQTAEVEIVPSTPEPELPTS